MDQIKLTPTERRAVLRAAKNVAHLNGYSCHALAVEEDAPDVVDKYGEFFERDPECCWLHNDFGWLRAPTQNERVLMLLLFAEATK